MRQENFMDNVLSRISGMMERVDGALDKYKGDLPFNTEEQKPEEVLQRYNAMTPQEFNKLIQTEGPKPLARYLRRIQRLRESYE